MFADTLQNQLGLNQVFKALNLNSKTIKQFHPKQQVFQPEDYVKQAGEILGISVVKGSGAGNKTGQGESFYSKVISSIQQKYPDLQECCIVAFSALAITSLGTIVALLACCFAVCCERSQAQCKPCCRVKNARDTCGAISPCCGVNDSTAHPDAAFQPFLHAQQTPHIPGARQQRGSAQRDSAQVTSPLLQSAPPTQSQPVKDWATWRQMPKSQSDTRV